MYVCFCLFCVVSSISVHKCNDPNPFFCGGEVVFHLMICLGQGGLGSLSVHPVPKCRSCHKAIMVITRRVHCYTFVYLVCCMDKDV